VALPPPPPVLLDPPFGFRFDLRSLNLTAVFALVFFFEEAILLLGCDVLKSGSPSPIGDPALGRLAQLGLRGDDFFITLPHAVNAILPLICHFSKLLRKKVLTNRLAGLIHDSRGRRKQVGT
jgi:hypothetical protein